MIFLIRTVINISLSLFSQRFSDFLKTFYVCSSEGILYLQDKSAVTRNAGFFLVYLFVLGWVFFVLFLLLH